MEKKGIPEQFTGKAVDFQQTVDFPSSAAAEQYFNLVRSKLMHVNDWNKIASGPSAEFCIVDGAGNQQDRTVEKGDHIRIDIPGPGLPSSGGYDWVRVEKILEENAPDYRKIALTLRPCPDPTNNKEDTAHFFKALATSSFLIEQSNTSVLVKYAGRNELVNTENESTWDNIRNFVIGVAAKIGASEPQWKALVDGLAKVKS